MPFASYVFLKLQISVVEMPCSTKENIITIYLIVSYSLYILKEWAVCFRWFSQLFTELSLPMFSFHNDMAEVSKNGELNVM